MHGRGEGGNMVLCISWRSIVDWHDEWLTTDRPFINSVIMLVYISICHFIRFIKNKKNYKTQNTKNKN